MACGAFEKGEGGGKRGRVGVWRMMAPLTETFFFPQPFRAQSGAAKAYQASARSPGAVMMGLLKSRARKGAPPGAAQRASPRSKGGSAPRRCPFRLSRL